MTFYAQLFFKTVKPIILEAYINAQWNVLEMHNRKNQFSNCVILTFSTQLLCLKDTRMWCLAITKYSNLLLRHICIHWNSLITHVRSKYFKRFLFYIYLCCKALISKTMSIRFHKKYFKIISHSLGFLWI